VERSYRRMLQAVQPDVVHIQHLQNVSARLPTLTRGRPVVLTLHDYWYRCATGQLVRVDSSLCEGPSAACADCARVRATTDLPAAVRPLIALAMGYRNLYLGWMLTYVDRFIAPSDFVRNQYTRWGLDPGRITVLPNGVNLERLATATMSQTRNQRNVVFGYLGSIAPSKGVHTLVQAFEGLPPEAELRIYGNLATFPDYAAELRAMAHHPGIRFSGPVPPRAVGEALAGLSYLVVPSLTHESLAMVVDEAHTLGVPVVASRLGALSRIRDGIDGRLFEAGDASALHHILQDLTAHPEQRGEYAAALPRVLTTGEHALQMVDIYREALSARS
jgi:glycosyltransferase involved in cell wall biosynthesis